MSTIRRARMEDAAGLYALEQAVIAEGRGVVQVPGELKPFEVWEGRMLGRLSDRDVWFVAEEAGRVVGQATLGRLGPSLLAHVAQLAVEVHPDAQGRGIGRALCAAVIDAADRSGVVRLELFVRADNDRAIALYRKFGFEAEGTHRAYALRDGRYVDALAMARLRPKAP